MKINILGFGVMGKQIAAVMQLMGHDVSVWTRSHRPENITQYKRTLRVVGRILPAPADDGGSISYVDELAELPAALTLEALVEDLGIKKVVLAGLSYAVDDVGLFTNASSFSPDELSPAAVGLHFFNPIHALKFAEITHDVDTLAPPAQALLGDLHDLGFELIRTHQNRGFIGNFILFREIASAFKLIDRYGYQTDEIDRVLNHMGHDVSLFDIVDLVGVDVVRTIIQNLKEDDPSMHLSPILDQAVEQNILGKKNRTSIRALIDS